MKSPRTPIVQTRRDAWTEINLKCIEHNLKELRTVIDSSTEIMAVVKADAYGHGASMIAKTLVASGVSKFGVASVDEGIQLRLADIKNPILILGPTPSWAIPSAVENNLDITIFSEEHLQDCIYNSNKLKVPINIHIKIDTGMHRIGIIYNKALSFIRVVQNTKEVNLLGIFSHLACAEDRLISELQISRWNEVINQISNKPNYLHFTNSTAVLSYPQIHYNLIRTGLELYGLQPDIPSDVTPLKLKQVMSLKGRITNLHSAIRGEGISYGHKYKVNKDKIKVATLPIGYADGLNRNLSNKIQGILNGQYVNQIGTITMDQVMFDVTDVPDVKIGDIVTLLGPSEDKFLSIDHWAKSLNTINYEISCMLKVRLPRIYVSN